jgi:hypothetical protein
VHDEAERRARLGVPEQPAVAPHRDRSAGGQNLDAQPLAVGKDDSAIEQAMRGIRHHDHPLRAW